MDLSLPELKNKIFRYIFRSHLGQLFKHDEIEPQQISLELTSGNAYLRQLDLDVTFLNEIGEQFDFPVRFVRGWLDTLHIHAPWTSWLTDGFSFTTEFQGLHLILEPLQDIDDAASMWSSAITRMADPTYKNENPALLTEGARRVDDFLKYVMSKVTISFTDTEISLQPRNSELGLALTIKLKSLSFCNEHESSQNVPDKEYGTKNRGAGNRSNTAYTTKIVDIEGVSLWITIPTESEEQSEIKRENDKQNKREIMFAMFSGKQKIKIFTKQTAAEDHAPGLRVSATLGDLILFLSPRQVYLLTKFMREYSQTNDIECQRAKPMTALDYQRINSILEKNEQCSGLQMGHGWSGSPTGIGIEQQFYSMHMQFDQDCGMSLADSIDDSASVQSTLFSERASSITRINSRGMMSNHSRAMSCTSSCVPRTSHDSGRDIILISLNISSVAIILLHEDILNVTENVERYTEDSIIKLDEMSTTFFGKFEDQNLSHILLEGHDIKSFLDERCGLNHMRLFSASLHCSLKMYPQKKKYEAFIRTYMLSLSECLFENRCKESMEVPLLLFEDPSQECLGIHMVTRGNYNCQTDIAIKINRCIVELDITIMDRLSALLNLLGSFESEESEKSKNTTSIEVSMPYVEFKLRFPIPDYRPLHNPERVPWWKRNVRPDYMTLKCSESKFRTKLSPKNKSPGDEYSFEFEVLDIYYNEPNVRKPTLIAQIGDKDHKFEPCKIIIKILPATILCSFEEREDPATESTFCKYFLQKMDNGPFTSKKIYHLSKGDHLDHSFPEQDFLIPGDCKEIEEFKSKSRDSAKLILEILLSSVKIQIVSKSTYEMIYNRINNDLLMWEPSAPKSRMETKKKEVTFEDCISAPAVLHHYDSDSEDYSDKEDYSLFYSTEGPELEDSVHPSLLKKYVDQSEMVIDLKIINGTIAFNPLVRDASLNVIPGQLGYFAIDLSEANVFMVSSYKGDSALDYLCVDVKSCDMRHHEMMPASEVRNFLPDLRRIPSHLYPVVSKSVGTPDGDRKNQQDRQMLTVALKILKRHETHNVKTVKIALGLNKSTLHYRVTAEPNSWVSQLVDFFKVQDFPIPGYKSKDVLSEFHLHTWDCAIDYRPLHLPLRCAVTLASFNMTSNISEISNGSKLRFLAEDADLYLSQDNPPKDGIASNVPMDIRGEYVNVVTLNMFELSLALNDKNIKNQPKLDLRVSTDCLKIHSCSDSLKALTDLIGYIAMDGDLISNESAQPGSAHASPRHGPGDETLVPVEGQLLPVDRVTEKQRREINSLINQALEDTTDWKKCKPAPPREDNNLYRKCPQVQKELGDLDASDDDFENSFVFIDEVSARFDRDPRGCRIEKTIDSKIFNQQFFPNFGVIIDSLRAPSDYPSPVYRYVLCEMNVIWQLYGGKDFSPTQEIKKEKKEKSLYNELYANHFSSTESLYSRYSSSSSPRERRMSEREWKEAGGKNRDKDVLMEVVINKIKCEFDIYPKKTLQAHRFAMLIKEYEIIDKMKTSEFNKFLCQHVSESSPRQYQAHMFTLSATNIRPPVMCGETECSIEFSLLPVRLYIDQESLEFMMKFFTELGQRPDEEKNVVRAASKHSTPLHQPPKLVVTYKKDDMGDNQDDGEVNLINLESSSTEERSTSPDSKAPGDGYSTPLFFRPVIFPTESFVKIDYKGKYVGGADGSMAGVLTSLIMGLAEINSSQIRLKRFQHRQGILGIDNLLNYIIQEWLDDIRKNQLPNVLYGVGPIPSVVQLLSGVRDLFWLPIEQYQKDGRIVKGLRRGANNFTTSTALAALELTFKFIHLLQVTAETAYDILSPGPAARQITNAKKKKKRYTQPQDIRQGVTNALWLVKEGFGESAETIAQVAIQEHEYKGYVGVVGGIARQIPPNLIKPIIIASEATNNVLGGIRSQLIPDAKTEANQKWRNFE